MQSTNSVVNNEVSESNSTPELKFVREDRTYESFDGTELPQLIMDTFKKKEPNLKVSSVQMVTRYSAKVETKYGNLAVVISDNYYYIRYGVGDKAQVRSLLKRNKGDYQLNDPLPYQQRR